MQKALPYIILALFLAIGIKTYTSYGMSWDEEAQHIIGQTTYDYLHNNDNRLINFHDKDYGVAFELPLIYLEKALNLESSQAIYQMRHLVTHLLFLLAAFFFYLLLKNSFKNKRLALLGMLMLLTQPLIYSHSFFNSKDIPLLSLFIISFYTLEQYSRTKTLGHLILFAFCSALTINLRVIGIIMPGLAFLFFLKEVIISKKIKRNARLFLLYFISTGLFLYTIWPYLWEQPFYRFQQIFVSMSKFRWNYPLLFNGETIPSNNLPWYYIPTYIGITSNLLLTVSFLLGFVLLVVHFFQSKISFLKEKPSFFASQALAVITVSLGSIIILQSVLYDSWRQLFFLMPFIVFISIYFLHSIALRWKKEIAYSIGLIIIGIHTFHCIKLFPYSHTYFNSTVSKNTTNHIRSNYEMDYWGTTYNEAIRNILNSDKADPIKLYTNTLAGKKAYFLLNKKDQQRIVYSEIEDADYFISCYRNHPEDYIEFKGKEFYKIQRQNNIISTTFKLK